MHSVPESTPQWLSPEDECQSTSPAAIALFMSEVAGRRCNPDLFDLATVLDRMATSADPTDRELARHLGVTWLVRQVG